MCLGTQLRLLDSRSFLERSPDGQRSPAVLDPTGAVAVAGVHHAGRHLSLPPSSDHHRLLLLSRRVHHLAEGTLHGSRGSQVLVDDADKQQRQNHDGAAKQLRRLVLVLFFRCLTRDPKQTARESTRL